MAKYLVASIIAAAIAIVLPTSSAPITLALLVALGVAIIIVGVMLFKPQTSTEKESQVVAR